MCSVLGNCQLTKFNPKAVQQLGPMQLGSRDGAPGPPGWMESPRISWTFPSHPERPERARKTPSGRAAGRLGGRNTKTSKASGRQRQEEATMGPGRPEMSQLLAPALRLFPLHCRSDLLKLGGC